MNLKEKLKNLPSAPGVYLMQNSSSQIIYIGKATSLKKRVASYFYPHIEQSTKNAIMLPQIAKIDYLVTKTETEALILESKLIRRYQPKYNILWRDDKSYPHLMLTLGEEFPRLFLARKREGRVKNARYFGPYTEVGQTRRTLRWLQRVFPLRLCKYPLSKDTPIPEKKVRSCLYYHIKQCPAPCLGEISQKKYREIVNQVILFLEGNHQELLKHLEKQMQQYSKKLDFEEARKIRDTISAIQNIPERIDFKEVRETDLPKKIKITQGLSELKKLFSLPNVPLHIEAFDISNISGKQAVGSLVVFEKGEPNKNLYRRYKIKTVNKIDDYKMISEVLSRRYKRILEAGEKFPDLILIDGGKGHLSTAVETLNTLHLTLPIIALAKEKEEIYLPSDLSSKALAKEEALVKEGLPKKSKPLNLPANSPALQLLQRIRDEAHRFAISYHKLLRKKDKFQPIAKVTPG
ncbi:MAG TPA: excinuclease ABC subunit C [Elusimicrobia bacterium]|jgi:excinuclease ABC subunit C|nr:excinuclease ABC subunit C [Elusimicrobiota bacterium]